MNKKLLIALTLLLVVQIVVSTYLISTAATIPIHWNIKGEIDGYGSPYASLLLPIMSVFTAWILMLCKSCPQLYNLPSGVKDKALAYSIAGRMLDWITLWIFILFTYLELCSLWRIENGIILILLILAGLPIIIYYMIRLHRA